MRTVMKIGGLLTAVTCLGLIGAMANAAAPGKALVEDFQAEPMPPGFQVVNTET